MKLIAESEGATLQDSVRLVVYVTDMFRFRPLVNRCRRFKRLFWGELIRHQQWLDRRGSPGWSAPSRCEREFPGRLWPLHGVWFLLSRATTY
jgi:hypothetical protein